MSEGDVASKEQRRPTSTGKGILKSESRNNYVVRQSAKSTPEPLRSSLAPKANGATAGSSSGQRSALLVPPSLSFTAPNPEISPISPSRRRSHHRSTPTQPTSSLRSHSPPRTVQKSFSSSSGKRKADEAEVDGGSTPPKDAKEHRATFAPEPRPHRASASGSVHAPSSYHRQKRARISLSSDMYPTAKAAVASLTGDSPNAKSTGSWSSRASKTSTAMGQGQTQHYQYSSRASSSKDTYTQPLPPRRSASRRSVSNVSIPISAFMSPHAPSISRSSTFHMRDPKRPPRIQDTPWTLTFPTENAEGESRWATRGWVERGGSPLHAWLFFAAFIIFPLWWIAAFLPIPKTRSLEGDTEKAAVVLDDPQVEYDANSWRKRCRIMSIVSVFTYIPFIVLVAIFA